MYLELCTPEQMENIYSELGTTKEAVQKDVQDLMDWMEKQPHLPDVRGKFTYLRISVFVTVEIEL